MLGNLANQGLAVSVRHPIFGLDPDLVADLVPEPLLEWVLSYRGS